MLEVLVADDDELVRESIAEALSHAGHTVTEACDGGEAAELIGSRVFDLAICDVRMPKLDGLTLLRRIRREAPGTAVVLMTTFGNIPDVVGSIHDGAVDYVTKPFDPDEFATRVVRPIAEHREMRRKFQDARARFVSRTTGATLVATSPPMGHVVDRIAVLGYSDVSVVVTGDRGTGKELVARTLHAQGSRREGPFVLADATLLPEILSEGWWKDYAGGTLVLDGVERLSLVAQARVLLALDQPGAVARRSAQWQPSGVRLITLSRERLADRVVAGQVLEPLWYRLQGIDLHVPTLAERGDDFVPLVTALLHEIETPGRTPATLTASAWAALQGHAFPGNVRELRWALEHAVALADGDPIDVSHLPEEVVEPRR